jgi:hypothetical protein
MTNKIKNAFTEGGTLTGTVSGLTESLIDSTVGGLSPLNNFGRYMTGSRAIIKVNDKLFGFAFAVSFNINTEHEENRTIDSYIAHELMPTRITVNGTMSMFHIPSRGPSQEMVQANVLSYLMHKYITIEISDQTTGQTIFKTNKAVITNRAQTLQAGEITTIQLTWKALGWSDELIPFYPQGADGTSKGGTSGGIKDAFTKAFK